MSEARKPKAGDLIRYIGADKYHFTRGAVGKLIEYEDEGWTTCDFDMGQYFSIRVTDLEPVDYERIEAPAQDALATVQAERDALERAKIALMTIASYSEDMPTWEEIVTGLESEANRLQQEHLSAADASGKSE